MLMNETDCRGSVLRSWIPLFAVSSRKLVSLLDSPRAVSLGKLNQIEESWGRLLSRVLRIAQVKGTFV
jgi:hypothetical protein